MHYTREAKIGIFVLAAVALFIFGGIQLGAFNFYHHNYASYTIQFKDIAGLHRKAEVRIAGVKVGWIEDIDLIEQDTFYACVHLLLDPKYTVYADAWGVVRKEGLLGPVYLELFPGTVAHNIVASYEQSLNGYPDDTSLDDLMRTVKNLALELQDVTRSVKQICGSITSVNQTVNFVDDVQDVSVLLKQTAQTVNEITTAAYEGNGFFGQMIKDDTVYHNIRYTADMIAHSFKRFSDLFFVYDGHVESMFETAEHACFRDSKAIFNMRIYPRHDYFYVIGVTTSQKGYIKRIATVPECSDICVNDASCPPDVSVADWEKFQYLCNRNQETIKRNSFKVDLQVGKFYKNVSLRAGLIEGTAGAAADIFIPFNGHYGIISTFKIYDLRGQHRIDDTRPHLKWINRLFLFDHVYLAIGFDDFASECNKSFFLGAGFRFGENDLKWFLPNYVGT